jgi:hypothetical protein
MRGYRTISGAALAMTLSAGAATAQITPPTFTKDVAPIFMKDCVSCHREGEMAPMALTTYAEARPWARAIKRKVASREMPPWFADPAHGTFRNDRALSQKEIDTIVAWVDANAPQGNPADMPAPPRRADGWNHPSGRPPDAIIEMPIEFEIPAEGQTESNGEETTFYVPVPFKDDVFIEASEVRPGNRAVVHHVIVNVRDIPPYARINAQGNLEDKTTGALIGAALRGATSNRAQSGTAEEVFRPRGSTWVGTWAAGWEFEHYREGIGKRIEAGRAIMFGMHYQATGKPEKDRTKIGLWFQKGPMRNELLTERVGVTHVVENTLMIEDVSKTPVPNIPAYAENWKIVGITPVVEDITIYNLAPHMHLRGKDMKFVVVYPDGKSETLLSVPKFSFTWQLFYELEKPARIPAGSKIMTVGHFDNSTNNKYNPAPEKSVYWSEQSWDEMFNGFMQYTIDSQEKPAGSTPQR